MMLEGYVVLLECLGLLGERMRSKILNLKKEDIIYIGENSARKTPDLVPDELEIDLSKVATAAFYEKPSPHTHLAFVGNLPMIAVKGEITL